MAVPDPLSVICTSSPGGVHAPVEPDHRHESPCGSLCGAGVQAQNVLAPSHGLGTAIRFADRIEIVPDPSAAMFAGPVVRQHHARGPPLSSI